MIISIDFDQTYAADPDMWDEVIKIMKRAGHTVYCTTCRPKWDTAGPMDRLADVLGSDDHIFFTDNRAKIEYMESIGYHVDIWIDDCPATVTGGGSVMWKQANPHAQRQVDSLKRKSKSDK